VSESSAAEPVTKTDEPEKRVSWAELFFDLVFVFAVTEVSALLRAETSWAGVGRSLVVFVPIFWSWVGTAVHANTHDIDNPLDRLGIFTIGLCGMFMALATPGAYTQRGVLFGAAYFATRIILAALIFRSRPMTVNAYLVGLVVTGPLLLTGGLLPDSARVTLWALAALVDLATPALTRRRLVSIHFHSTHLPERFGLFLIIALGESVVAVGTPAAAAPQLHVSAVAAVAAAFALACGLWWVYFHFAADAIRYALATASVQTDIVREVLSYGHLAFISAIINVVEFQRVKHRSAR
jgi:low temperature requirement protein LtrA